MPRNKIQVSLERGKTTFNIVAYGGISRRLMILSRIYFIRVSRQGIKIVKLQHSECLIIRSKTKVHCQQGINFLTCDYMSLLYMYEWPTSTYNGEINTNFRAPNFL